MISVNEAKSIIEKNCKPLAPQRYPVGETYGLILSEDVFAKVDIPSFPQSSMDGYAIAFQEREKRLQITGKMVAGAQKTMTLMAGEAARIYTGAPLPEGADTVVMQEKTSIDQDWLTVLDHDLKQGVNVRPVGSEIKKNALAISSGSFMSVAALGFLASIGIPEVSVFPRPKVAVILTGNELQEPDKPLSFGQVYDANSFMLRSALLNAGIRDIEIARAEDDLDALCGILQTALKQNDLILLTGGVSVGDYDFVADAARRCGIETHFHKIKQKPGKPLYFGTTKNKTVFGLPGNPSSALTCFYIYVLPAIESMLKRSGSIKNVIGKIDRDYTKPKGLTHFLKARFMDGTVHLLHAQESFRLHSFAQSNCLAIFEEDKEIYKAGDTIHVQLIGL